MAGAGPRRSLVLAAMATVLILAFGALSYFALDAPGDHASPVVQPPTSSPVVGSGDVPEPFLGTWSAVVTNADGENSRRLTIRQGNIGAVVMTMTADGSSVAGSYHCDFTAKLAAVRGQSIQLSASTVAEGSDRSYCAPGDLTTLTLVGSDRLKRRNSTTGETLTYRRLAP
ncbi:hypothetical protein GCM10010521_72710 [Streptomyces rameus]|uniref:META domain-containing protein n=1 Tax=Streptomyces rameus TaxID=68261 RepID=A0ABN3V8I8_9ACTN